MKLEAIFWAACRRSDFVISLKGFPAWSRQQLFLLKCRVQDICSDGNRGLEAKTIAQT